MLVRSRSPLRLGLAGGGTDVSPYSDIHGGYVLNATIDLYSHCTIETLTTPTVVFEAQDMNVRYEGAASFPLQLRGDLLLHKAVYNAIMRNFNGERAIGLRVVTRSDAPPGSGLGSSSSLVVAMVAAFRELLALPLGEYDIAKLAYEIEREDCSMAGGKQDQYAATFGGFNFMEFYEGDRVVVNPLRIRRRIENELQSRLILYFTGVSRVSSKIIEEQTEAALRPETSAKSLDAMHEIKAMAMRMKEYLLKGDLDSLSSLISSSWEAKKQTSAAITSPEIENVATTAFNSGASALKISGAGGGGFMMILVDPDKYSEVERSLATQGGHIQKSRFSHEGAEAWTVS